MRSTACHKPEMTESRSSVACATSCSNTGNTLTAPVRICRRSGIGFGSRSKHNKDLRPIYKVVGLYSERSKPFTYGRSEAGGLPAIKEGSGDGSDKSDIFIDQD